MKSDIAMYAVETIKSGLEHLTGIAQPTARELRKRIKERKPRATVFKDNNHIPNNPTLPFIHYSSVISLTGALDPAAVFERVFKANNWIGSWRNGIYDYVHYHPRTHEVLGIAQGRARVRFGGKQGKLFHLKPGDVVILPEIDNSYRSICACRGASRFLVCRSDLICEQTLKPHNIQHALDESPGRFTQVSFPRFSVKQCACNVLCDITRPFLGSVKGHHSYWIGVLALADIFDDSLYVCCRFIGFHIGATELAELVEHDVNSDIVRLLVWS
jgi:mannose-6-phosphate isomerase-like protein (cupin superfamily)